MILMLYIVQILNVFGEEHVLQHLYHHLHMVINKWKYHKEDICIQDQHIMIIGIQVEIGDQEKDIINIELIKLKIFIKLF